MHLILFLVFAGFCLGGAVNLLLQSHPISSALSLIVVMTSLAVLYLLLGAEFLAAAQVIVYAGAIMVLIVFVIMLLNMRTETSKNYVHGTLVSCVVAVLTLFVISGFLSKSPLTGVTGNMTPDLILKVGHTELIGKAMFTDFLLPFEITSILLLVAIVGSVILAKRKL